MSRQDSSDNFLAKGGKIITMESGKMEEDSGINGIRGNKLQTEILWNNGHVTQILESCFSTVIPDQFVVTSLWFGSQ